MSLASDIRAIITGPFSVPVVFGAVTTRGQLVNRPLRVDDGLGGETTVPGDTLRVMVADVAGVTRGSSITVDGVVRQVRDAMPNRDRLSTTLVLA